MSGAQISMWGLLDQAPQPAASTRAALTIELALAAAAEYGGIALQVAEDIIIRLVEYEFAEAVLCRRVAPYVGDGILPGTHYLLMRFHEDGRREVATRKVRDELWARGERFAIDAALHDEAQSFFFYRTRNARPRHLGTMV